MFSNDFMNFFTEIRKRIRNTIVNIQSFIVSYDSVSIIAPHEELHRFTAELNKLTIASKPTTLFTRSNTH